MVEGNKRRRDQKERVGAGLGVGGGGGVSREEGKRREPCFLSGLQTSSRCQKQTSTCHSKEMVNRKINASFQALLFFFL